jgi:prevent-host-death family protein
MKALNLVQLLLYYICMKVTAAFAKTNLPKLLKAVERGESVTISRYLKPVAVLSPAPKAQKPKRKLGTLKGKIKILDPNWAAPMTDEEAEDFIEGRY